MRRASAATCRPLLPFRTVAAGVLIALAAHADWDVTVREGRTAKADLKVAGQPVLDLGLSTTEVDVAYTSSRQGRGLRRFGVTYETSEITSDRPWSPGAYLPEWGLYSLSLPMLLGASRHQLFLEPRLRSATNDSRDREEWQLDAIYTLGVRPDLRLGLAYISDFGPPMLVPVVEWSGDHFLVKLPLLARYTRQITPRLHLTARLRQQGGTYRGNEEVADEYRFRQTELAAEVGLQIPWDFQLALRAGVLAWRRFDVDQADGRSYKRPLNEAGFVTLAVSR